MKKGVIVITIFLLMFVASSDLFALDIASYNDVCWLINGWPLKVAALEVGRNGADVIYTIAGHGTSTGAPIVGTVVYPPSGPLRFSFEIVAASESQNAVVHQLELDRTTLNGTGYARWFDSSNEGNSTATRVSCSSLASEAKKVEPDLTSQGLR